jgi:hypothetical protein
MGGLETFLRIAAETIKVIEEHSLLNFYQDQCQMDD